MFVLRLDGSEFLDNGPGSSIFDAKLQRFFFSELAHDTDHVVGGRCRQCHHFKGLPGLHDFFIRFFYIKVFFVNLMELVTLQ